MIDESLFPKLVEPKSEAIMLFSPDLWRVNENICPFSGHKLYEMQNRPLKFCKAKGCEYKLQTGKTFVVKVDKSE